MSASTPARGLLHTFQLDVPKADRLQDDSIAEAKVFHARRSHKKSRLGCIICKRRRKKCDEIRPACGKCRQGGFICEWPKPRPPSIEGVNALNPRMYSMSVDLLETDMSELVQQTASGRPFQLRLLQHFHAYTTTTIGGPKVHQVMQYTVSQRAWNRPHLMHLALSVAAAHLKHMYTLDSPHQLQRDCAVAEAVHGELGLHLWREQISAGKYNIDADGAVASTFLTSVLAMSQNDETPWTSLDDEKGTRIMLPLSAINGFMSLRASFASLQDSSWSAVLSESDDDEESFTKPRPGVHGLPAAFVKLCSLETASTPETNRYHGIVRLLTPLLTLPPDVSHCGKLMAFIGRTWRWFQPLIMQCDQRGLLLLAYWFSLLRQVDQWWILSRAVAECRAIIEYLSKTTNTLIHALLVYPKSFGEEGLDRIWLEDPVLLDLETPVEELD